MVGNHGSDVVSGGDGDQDVVRGDLGFDRLEGGSGVGDIASFAGASESVLVDLTEGIAKGDGRDRLAASRT